MGMETLYFLVFSQQTKLFFLEDLTRPWLPATGM